MKKNDLKKLIKPLVKECIHEVLLEEGLLSNVVAEVAKGMQGNLVVETQQKSNDSLFTASPPQKQQVAETRKKMQEHRQKLMKSIGSDAYNGVNLFEGTEAISNHEAAPTRAGAVDLGNPKDAGVDISSLVGGASQIWKAMK
tara:strand:+ start:6242 stop:6667 length:426 start_codon:yes stop_codon:yes gene_type:complete